ncbi:NAD-dependent epimerase/dehydratase family protein [Streptomyces sp. NBC_01007]|nr:NAD-dependent epimerase/dehydratase family protein [Streptomyces sp. NBC_01007]
MRVVVSGGSGFLGSHLCQALLRGDRVRCPDDLSSGRPVNIAPLLHDPRFAFEACDVTEPFTAPGDVDAVAHLAGPASPVDHRRLQLETPAAGSRGTENMLRLADRHSARFVLASTSEVYGDPIVHPQDEEYWGHVNPIGPRSVYDEAKRFAEAVSMAYRRTRAVDAGIVRIFNTYGPRMRSHDGRVVSSFIRQALAGEALTLFGDGSQTRSSCYADDMVGGLVAMIDSHRPGPFDLGYPSERTVPELAEPVIMITGSGSGLHFLPLPADDPVRRRPVISRAREGLGRHQRVPLDEGLRHTAERFVAQSRRPVRPSAQSPVGRPS